MSGIGIYYKDWGDPGEISWIIMIHKDETIGFCTEAWVDREGRTHMAFRRASDIPCIPKRFGSEEEARRWFHRWKTSFPVNAAGWREEITEFEA